MQTKLIKATELASGMSLVSPIYRELTKIAQVYRSGVGLYVTAELVDGSKQEFRIDHYRATIEVAS